MALPSFHNMNELLQYLTAQEQRITELEKTNAELMHQLDRRYVRQDGLARTVKYSLPDTGLLSKNLFVRAFSVWGHFVFAQLIIAMGLGLVYLVLFVWLLKSFIR